MCTWWVCILCWLRIKLQHAELASQIACLLGTATIFWLVHFRSKARDNCLRTKTCCLEVFNSSIRGCAIFFWVHDTFETQFDFKWDSSWDWNSATQNRRLILRPLPSPWMFANTVNISASYGCNYLVDIFVLKFIQFEHCHLFLCTATIITHRNV